MKAEIHPKYYPEAKVTCAGCARTFTVGATKPELHVELCSNCHPFYTGKQKLVDTAGRVDRFRARAAKAKGKDKKAAPEAKPAETTPADADSPEARLEKMKQSLQTPDTDDK